MINIQKSKSINTTAISSKKNLYERIINPNLKANRENQNELNKKIDILNNTLLNEQKIIKSKNKVKYDIEKEKIKEIINIERAKKLKKKFPKDKNIYITVLINYYYFFCIVFYSNDLAYFLFLDIYVLYLIH